MFRVQVKTLGPLVFLLYLLVIGLVPVALSAERMQILAPEEPPMSFMEGKAGKSRPTGIIVDIVKELIRRTETEGRVNIQPWARAYRTGLGNANVILFTAARTPVREKSFHWIGPVIVKRWVLAAKRGSGLKIRSLTEARKIRRIAVVQADAREKYLRKLGFRNLYPVTLPQQAMGMLMLNRVDLMVTADIEIPILARKIKVRSQEVESVFVLKKIRSYILISKKTSPKTVRRWKKAMEDMKRDGAFVRIGRKWARKLEIPLSGEHGIIKLKK